MQPCLDRIYRHLEWADARLVDALERIPDPPEEAVRLMAHVLQAEALWLARIQGREVPGLAPWAPLGREQFRAAAQTSSQAFRALLAAADDRALAAPIAYRTSKGDPFTTALGDILLQVALHGAHHRGQIAACLRRAGLEPAATDYIVFSRETAQTDWGSV